MRMVMQGRAPDAVHVRIFKNKNKIGEPKVSTVRPECGRLIFFTSGSENVHRVHKVESGTEAHLKHV